MNMLEIKKLDTPEIENKIRELKEINNRRNFMVLTRYIFFILKLLN